MSSATGQNRTLVVKVGTNVVSRPEGGLNTARLRALAEETAELQKAGHRPLLVSSGAIGAGMDVFGWKKRPTLLRDKQAAAAVGQVVLMQAYREAFAAHGIAVAQVLLTRVDLEDRARYLNARNTLTALLERKVVPVINENDTVSTDEIQFGDNDTLASIIAAKMEARTLFLLTDVDGLLTELGEGGKILPEVFQVTPDIEALAGAVPGSAKSVGGMGSKIRAARFAMASGVEVWIASGRRPGIVRDILAGRGVGTRFEPQTDRLNARRRWIAFGRPVRGSIAIDDGAVKAIVEGKRSLLPSGVARVEGSFRAGDTVRVLDASGREVARGLSAFSAADAELIRGRKTAEAGKILGRDAAAELIHRNNLVVLDRV
jgi:glutamate 5-kinase